MGIVQEVLRIPSATKSVDSRLLNLAGTQVARTLTARALQRGRQRRPADDGVATLRRDGILVIPEFLLAADFAVLANECAGVFADGAIPRVQHDHGKTRVEQIDVLPLAGGRRELCRFLKHPRLAALLEGAECRSLDPLSGHRVLERLVQLDSDLPDREAALHVDTFFHTHKAWLYLSDVEPQHGPLAYVPGSHRLGWHHLVENYRTSIGTGPRSRRVTDQEVRARGLQEVVYTCKANTLVIANTAGYHRRLPGIPGQTRHAIQISCRFNPFFPSWIDAERQQDRVKRLLGRVRG